MFIRKELGNLYTFLYVHINTVVFQYLNYWTTCIFVIHVQMHNVICQYANYWITCFQNK